MGNAVVHFEVTGKDGKKLQQFYENLFGWKIQPDPTGYGMVEAGEGGIGGGVASAENGPSVTFYVDVDDCQKFLDKAVSLGGSVAMPPQDHGGMVTFALLKDPEGNMVGVAKTH